MERRVEVERTAEPVRCPFCRGRETELYALFGSQISTSQHYCRTCRTVFERIKWSCEDS